MNETTRNRRTHSEVVIKELNKLLHDICIKQSDMKNIQKALVSVGREKMAVDLGGEIEALEFSMSLIRKRKNMIEQGADV